MIKEKTYLVLVKNLILKASVGIYSKEKIKKQKVRFNICVIVKDNIKKKNNDISDFVSYEDIRSQFMGGSFYEKYNLVVFDETQRIKNRGSNTYLACKALNTDRIWALTGTPIENSRDDLISIMDIVKYGLIADYMAKVTIHEKIKHHFSSFEKILFCVSFANIFWEILKNNFK